MELSLEERFAAIFQNMQSKRHNIDRSKISLETALLSDYFVRRLEPRVIEEFLGNGNIRMLLVQDFLSRFGIKNVFDLTSNQYFANLINFSEEVAHIHISSIAKKIKELDYTVKYDLNYKYVLLARAYQALLTEDHSKYLVSTASDSEDLKAIVLIDMLLPRLETHKGREILDKELNLEQKALFFLKEYLVLWLNSFVGHFTREVEKYEAYLHSTEYNKKLKGVTAILEARNASFIGSIVGRFKLSVPLELFPTIDVSKIGLVKELYNKLQKLCTTAESYLLCATAESSSFSKIIRETNFAVTVTYLYRQATNLKKRLLQAVANRKDYIEKSLIVLSSERNIYKPLVKTKKGELFDKLIEDYRKKASYFTL